MNLEVVGPFSSGTNLVRRLLVNDVPDVQNFSFRIWKHSVYEENFLHLLNTHPDVQVVVCVRDVFSWIQSMLKCSYEFRWNKKLESLIYLQFETSQKIDSPVHSEDMKWDNIVACHNYYYSMYQRVSEAFPNRVRFIRYMDIIDEEKAAQICSHLTLEKVREILGRPAKGHGNPVQNNHEALAKLQKVQSLFSSEEIAFINKHSKFLEGQV